jgi:hypothetical protein
VQHKVLNCAHCYAQSGGYMIKDLNKSGNMQTEQTNFSQPELENQTPFPFEEFSFLRVFVETLPNGLIADEI